MIGYTFLMLCYLLNVIICGVMIAKDKTVPLDKKTWGTEAFIWLLSLFAFFSLAGVAVNWLLGLIFALWAAGIVRGVTQKLSQKELTGKDAIKSGTISIIMMILLTFFVSVYG